jgi:hypothetical protein
MEENENLTYKEILTLLGNSTSESAFPMLASILSSGFSSTDYRDVSPNDPDEHPARDTTPISLINSLGYVKAFLALPNSRTPPFDISFDNLDR